MKKLKKLISILTFQIGVNVIGLPEFHTVNLDWNPFAIVKQKSKFIP